MNRRVESGCKSCSLPKELTVLDDFRFKERNAEPRGRGARAAQARARRGGGYATATYGSKSTDYGVIGQADGDGSARKPKGKPAGTP
jgi:hypothetical protein